MTTTLALAHADFGPVELRFSNDATGLSVALASSDPDFARAIQGAVQPPAAPTPTDGSAAQQRQSGQHGNGQFDSHPGQTQGHSQGTGQQAARRDPHDRFAAHNPSQPRPDGSGPDQGIFA